MFQTFQASAIEPVEVVWLFRPEPGRFTHASPDQTGEWIA
jgi:hypothetical protein